MAPEQPGGTETTTCSTLVQIAKLFPDCSRQEHAVSGESLVLRTNVCDALEVSQCFPCCGVVCVHGPVCSVKCKLSPLREAQRNCAASSTGGTWMDLDGPPCRGWSNAHRWWILNNNLQIPFLQGPKERHGRKGNIKRIHVTESALLGEKKICFLCIILFCSREPGEK